MPFNEEKIETIKYAMGHPLHPNRRVDKEEAHQEKMAENTQKEPHPDKPFGKKISDALFHTPTDAELGLPPGPATTMPKKEVLETIEHAERHPTHPWRPKEGDKHKPSEQQHSDHDVWTRKQVSKEDAIHDIEHALKHPLHPSSNAQK